MQLEFPLRRAGFGVALVVVVAPLLATTQGARSSVYVTVVDDRGAAVRGLGAADFALRDGGQRQAVLDAVPATDPFAVAIVADGFEASDAGVISRATSAALSLQRTNPGTRIGRVESDVPIMIDPTAPVAGPPPRPITQSLDFAGKIQAACHALGTASPDRRVLIALLRRGPHDASVRDADHLVDLVTTTRAAVWVIEVSAPSGSAPAATSTALDDLLKRLTDLSGSERQVAPTTDALPTATARAVDLLASQYLVTYTWPDPMLSQFNLVTRHDAGTVLVPSWR